jgi:hypothetical protein
MTVWTAGTTRRGAGRWHTTPACGFLVKPKLLRERTQSEAAALGYWQCPYCCPLPPCCVTGNHATYSAPMVDAPDLPEWEQEMLATAEETD